MGWVRARQGGESGEPTCRELGAALEGCTCPIVEGERGWQHQQQALWLAHWENTLATT